MSEGAGSRGWLGTSAGFRRLFPCLLLVALTFAAFGNALRNGFVSFDDWLLVQENTRIRSLAPRSILLMLRERDPNSHAWLPLRELSYAVDYRLWGLDPAGYHLTNIALHAANAVLAYALLVRVIGRPSLAILGAAWFAVHPAQVESVTWVSGRRDVLYAFFYLLGLLAYVAHERRVGQARWVPYGASVVLLLASLLSKASAMTFPVVLLLWVWLLSDWETGSDLWRRLAWTAPHWLLAIVLTGVHTLVAQRAGVVKGQALADSLSNVPLIFSEYLRLVLFPVHLATPHGDTALRWSEHGARIACQAAAVVAVMAAAWWAAPRRSSGLFWLGWWFLLLLPVANFIPLSVLVAERYLYLPLLGACGLGAEVVGRLAATGRWWRRALAAGCALAVVGLLAGATHHRNKVWENSFIFWQDGVSKWPSTPVMRIGLASAYADENDLERSWQQYMAVALSGGRAASVDPEHLALVNAGLKNIYYRLARQREAKGQRDAALEVYGSVIRLLPEKDTVVPRVRLAQAYERMGMAARAREQVLAVQKLEPDRAGLAEWLRRLEGREKGEGEGGKGLRE